MSTLMAMMGAASLDPRGDAIFRPEDDGLNQVFIVPPGVFSVCAVLIGGGNNYTPDVNFSAGGRGGNLRWLNDLAVTPGERLHLVFTTPVVGNFTNLTGLYRDNGSGDRGSLIFATTSSIGGDVGGGNGGNPGSGHGGSAKDCGGGGAGGYSGAGGRGYSGLGTAAATAGNGGAAGGGGATMLVGGGYSGMRGGDTYIYGEGVSGQAGVNGSPPIPPGDGSPVSGKPGRVKGGAGGGGLSGQQSGAYGIARILWGAGRAFPSTAVSTSTD